MSENTGRLKSLQNTAQGVYTKVTGRLSGNYRSADAEKKTVTPYTKSTGSNENHNRLDWYQATHGSD